MLYINKQDSHLILWLALWLSEVEAILYFYRLRETVLERHITIFSPELNTLLCPYKLVKSRENSFWRDIILKLTSLFSWESLPQSLKWLFMGLNFLLTGLLSSNIYSWENLTRRGTAISLRMTYQLKARTKTRFIHYFARKDTKFKKCILWGGGRGGWLARKKIYERVAFPL